jgi:hypothetical protein
MPVSKQAWFKRPKPNDKWKALRSLPRFDEIVQRLKEGQSPDYVARLIQDEMGEWKEEPLTVISNRLRQYRAEVIGVVAVEDGADGPDPLDRMLTEKVNLYEQYAFLINAQSWRIKRALTRESKQTGMLASLYRDMDVLRQSLKDFADFQMETGMVRRQPVLLDATLSNQTGTTVSMSMMLNADAATRNEARAATNELLKLLAEPASIDVGASLNGEKPLDDDE